jgi:hypothetical protein
MPVAKSGSAVGSGVAVAAITVTVAEGLVDPLKLEFPGKLTSKINTIGKVDSTGTIS